MSDNAPHQKYDVFVSFRGADIRDGFLSHLKHEFPRRQINAFFDDQLEKGEEIWPSLEKAIEGSFISLVIFSKEYASSRWCLEELAKILECREKHKQAVIPVFYKVEPTNVRNQKESYEKAFHKHVEQYDSAKVQKWRDSLKKAADLSGINSSNFGEEAPLQQEIIKIVFDHVLMRFDKNPIKSNGLVGIDESIARLESLLHPKEEGVRIIGVWGMGGIGKTTIAAEVFKKLYSQYHGCCFLANVSEEIRKNGTTFLKQKLFSTLLKEDVKINTPTGLPSHVGRRIGSMKVLIVLDDVNGLNQAEKLFGTHSCFGSGSRIIITTRDKQVLAGKVNDTHEIGKLGPSEALELFSLTAFKHFEMEYSELVSSVIIYTEGIPLVLKILGDLLRGKDKKVWQSQLDKLKRMPNREVHDIMRSSYDDLDSEEQELFLDLGCFLCDHVYKVDYIKSLLNDHEIEDSVSVGLERLKDKALITISEAGYVFMDNIIKQMACEIVRQKSNKEPRSYSRLWDTNDVYEVLTKDKGTDAIRSIGLGSCFPRSDLELKLFEELKLSPHIFVKMSKLQFLAFDDPVPVNFFPQGIEYLPTELRYLSLRRSFLTSLPEQFSAEKLVILELSYSRVTRLWRRVKNLVNLKVVKLRFCEYLQELPNFTKATNLEVVDVTGCDQLSSVHPSIFSLRRLKLVSDDAHLSPFLSLCLISCPELIECSVITKDIVNLDLSLTCINALPPSFVHESKLETLVLRKSAIERLPLCTKNLARLRDLDLYFCQELWILPELPPSLETLRAVDCKLLRIVLFPSTAAKQLREKRKKVEFWNCFALDLHSLRGIELNAQINMMKFAYLSYQENNYAGNYYKDYNDDYCSFQVMYVYPGSCVPRWLKYKNQNTEDYIIIDLSSDRPSPQLGFIFCFVLHEDSREISDKTLEFKIMVNGVENEGKEDSSIIIHTSVSCDKFASDHVCVMYDQRCSYYLNDRTKNLSKFKIRATARFISTVPEQKRSRWLVLKGLGVSLINTKVYGEFVQQMKLPKS